MKHGESRQTSMRLRRRRRRQRRRRILCGSAIILVGAARRTLPGRFRRQCLFNTAVTALLDEQCAKMAQLDGDATGRPATPTSLDARDVGGLNATLHKNLVGSNPRRNRAERWIFDRTQGRTDNPDVACRNCAGIPQHRPRGRALGR